MKNVTEKRRIGNLGEDLASRYLTKHGFDIIEKNYLKKCGEIDLIAKKEGKIHFVEVKSVTCETIPDVSGETDESSNYRPEDNLHPWKLQRLTKTIQIYLAEKGVSPACAGRPETDWVFDVITVYIDKKRLISKVSMLENTVL